VEEEKKGERGEKREELSISSFSPRGEGHPITKAVEGGRRKIWSSLSPEFFTRL